MRKPFLFLLLAGLAAGLHAQNYPVLTIQQIQTVPQDSLVACRASSLYVGDTVITTGVVVMDARITPPGGGAPVTNAQGVQGGNRNIWLQNGTGPFSGIDLFTTNGVPVPVPGTDVLDLVAGDSVKVTGIILEFSGETEIVPLNIELLASGKAVGRNPVEIASLNNSTRINNLETGEQWEGVYAEFYDVTVVTVDPFSGGNRVSFNVADAAGNRMNVSDRFMVQRLPANNPPGNFVAPTVGTVYDTLRGVIAHSQNGCIGTGRGYELFPFKSSDYVVQAGSSAPLISAITRNPVAPSSSQNVNVSATITDVDGTVTSAKIFYAVGQSNPNYLEAPMTQSGSTWTGTIPETAFSDGDFVKYYVSASDDDNLTANNPSVPSGNASPLFFTARDNGLTVYDVQFTPYSNGNSGYTNLEVTVTGIVTASADTNDLGYVYIQQEGQTEWAGLSLTQNSALAGLRRGDRVRATGVIQESFNFTVMVVNSIAVLSQGNALPAPIDLNPALFTTYSFAGNEKYEGMLVRLKSNEGDLYVVTSNADGTSPFAEYRVGESVFDPATGCRVLAGRVTNSVFSSLYFSYVNDSMWITEAGLMQVPACVVQTGDTVTSLTGIMNFSFSNMKLLPRNNADAVNFRTEYCASSATALDPAFQQAFRIYPNPASDVLHASFELPRTMRLQASLRDLSGRTVLQQSQTAGSGAFRLDLSQLPAGIYIFTVISETGLAAREKVLIAR